MIPTFIAIGLVAGFLPRPWNLLGILVSGLAWPVVRVISGATAIDAQSMIGEFAIAAVNAAVGSLIGRLILSLVTLVRAK